MKKIIPVFGIFLITAGLYGITANPDYTMAKTKNYTVSKSSKAKKGYRNCDSYNKYTKDELGRAAVCLPSTSPANAAWSIERLVGAWRIINE